MTQVPDVLKHAAILASTAGLPKPLRLPARFRLLSRFQLAKAARADIVIVVHPKSGGTWLRVMVSRLYQVKYGLPSRRIVKTDELYNRNPALPRFLITNGHYTYEGVLERSFASLAVQSGWDRKKVVFLARHPCDVAVSWYLQFTKRISAYKRELIAHTLRQPVDPAAIPMWEFVMHPELGLPALVAYLNRWERNLSQIAPRFLLRYEDLRARPADTMRRLTSFMGESFGDEAIEDAVAFAAFDNLKQLERTHYFSNWGLRLHNPNDPDSFKVRRGKVGGYRDYFTPEQTAEMDALVRSRLSSTFGY
ncbi:MAG: sulfotransferase domain-containing protein [Candidatus Binatia bacterium]